MSKLISKVIGEKGQWREYKARARKLPASLAIARRSMRWSGT